MEKAMNKFNWMKKKRRLQEGIWKSPESYIWSLTPHPLINQHEFLTVLIFLYCAMDPLGKIKGVRLRRPKDAENNKNFYAKPYPLFSGSRA